MSIPELEEKLEELEKGNEQKRRENQLFIEYLAREKRYASLKEDTKEVEIKGKEEL